jgi:hypothetical protein
MQNIPPQVKHLTLNEIQINKEDFLSFPNTIESLKLSDTDSYWGNNTKDFSLLPASITSLTIKKPNSSSYENGFPPNIKKLKVINVHDDYGVRRRRKRYRGGHFLNESFCEAISRLYNLNTLVFVNYSLRRDMYSFLPPNARIVCVKK